MNKKIHLKNDRNFFFCVFKIQNPDPLTWMSSTSFFVLDIPRSSVADPHEFKVDLDPGFHLNADPESDF